MRKQSLKQAIRIIDAGGMGDVLRCGLDGCPEGGWPETKQAILRMCEELPPRSERSYTVYDIIEVFYYVDHADRYRLRDAAHPCNISYSRHASVSVGDRGLAVAESSYCRAEAGRYGIARVGYRGRAVAGDRGCAVAGNYGTARAGDYGTAKAGDYGQAEAGRWGGVKVGRYGRARAGCHGHAYAGIGGSVSAGHDGRISIAYRGEDGEIKIATADVGENGIEPYVTYRLDGEHKFVRCAEDEERAA
jgi:hypothetical protein